MRRWGFMLAFALVGCDSVAGLDHLYECPDDDDDCDELLDRDDPCPADPGNTSDVDDDDVGDACDPDLNRGIDSLLEFEGFATKDPRWMARGDAAWDVRDSALVVEAGAVEREVPPNSQPTVEVLVDPEYAGEGSFVSVFVSSKASTGIPLECRVEHSAAGDVLVMRLMDAQLNTFIEIDRVEGLPGSPRDGLRIYGGQMANYTVRCRARYGRDDALYVDWDAWKERVDFDHIGLRTHEARGEFRALAIYTTAQP
jgi:hypothetical protein